MEPFEGMKRACEDACTQIDLKFGNSGDTIHILDKLLTWIEEYDVTHGFDKQNESVAKA